MILSCQQISLAFGTEVILDKISFHIEEHEKTAIVGINGAGKSTLLKIIMGELTPDSGEVIISRGKTIGYLAQHQDIHSEATIYEEMMKVRENVVRIYDKLRQLELDMKHADEDKLPEMYAAYDRLNHAFEQENGYALQSEVTGVLKGLGFTEEDFNKKVSSLSGGQKTRISLGCLLLTKPDIILLDEPTNHLDMKAIAWLETFLQNYKGAVIIVAHDRYFLDRIVTKVVEIENHKARMYSGNYSAFAEKKAQIRDAELKAWMNQQQEIKHQEEVIAKLKSFNREKSIRRAESREKMLAKIERVEKPVEYEKPLSLSLTPSVISGNDVLTVTDFAKSFGENHLFDHLSFSIKRGEKVAIIGKNGTGKTTLLKLIQGMIPVDEGSAVTGSHVEIGYYDQEHQMLNDDKTIFEEIQDDYPDLTNTAIRNVLAAFLFTGDDVFKPIHLLSGGEKGRVSLAKLMLSKANFLLLDEPTNHLDITSKEILESAINKYEGTVLYVSHDRYFINRTATRILDLTGHKLLSYSGNYAYYLEKKDMVESRFLTDDDKTMQTSAKKDTKEEGKLDWQEQKKLAAKKRKIENEYQKTEQEIEALETDIANLDEELMRPEYACNAHKLNELSTAREEKETALTAAMEQWERLAEQLEEFEVTE